MNRRKFLKTASGLLVPLAPAIVRAQILPGPALPVGGGGGGGTNFVPDNNATQNFAASGTSYAFSLPTVAANALCIVSILANNSSPLTGVSDAVGSYTLLGRDTVTANSAKMEVWYAFRTAAQVGATLTINTTAAGSGIDVIFASFTGATSAQLDTGASFLQNSTNTLTWTTSVAKTLAIGGVGPNNGNLTPATGGWVAISFPSAFNTFVYKITSAQLSSETLGADGSGGYFTSVLGAFK